jgi:hypothetical protein
LHKEFETSTKMRGSLVYLKRGFDKDHLPAMCAKCRFVPQLLAQGHIPKLKAFALSGPDSL